MILAFTAVVQVVAAHRVDDIGPSPRSRRPAGGCAAAGPTTAGYDAIRVSSDADDAQLQDLHEHVVRTSPASNTIECPVKLRTRRVKT